MSNSQVPWVVLNEDNTISIEVNVSGFNSGDPVELSGQATQANGAIATFYSVQPMPVPNGSSAPIWVKSIPVVGENGFDKGFPVTVVVRATEAWFTVLNTEQNAELDPELQGPTGAPPKAAWASSAYGWAVAPASSSPWAAAPAPAPAVPAPSAQLRHGKWWDRVKSEPLDTVMGGRFTRLFPDLPGASFAHDDLKALAARMTAPPEAEPADATGPDPEENPGIPAAYTYLGQFIDHDLTFDPISQLRQRVTTKSQLQALVDFRTPRFDLDNLYGHGPDDQPYMYDEDGVHMLLGAPMQGSPFDPEAAQLPRGPNGRALIGDPRNDENRIVAQLHAIFLRFHNRIVDHLGGSSHVSFAQAREQVCWYYQWVMVYDFLPTILPKQIYDSVFPDSRPSPAVPKLRENDLPLMPVEFSVAAYRFGHSMVRPRYKLNQAIERPIFSGIPSDRDDLGGFRPIPANWAIDWQYFINLGDGTGAPAPQLSYKIDTSLVNPLGKLPPQIAVDPSSLAQRNLERGLTFQLPSGQRVAEALGVPPLTDDELVIGMATAGSTKTPMKDIAPAFAGNAPLWAYVLSEAQVTSRNDPAHSGLAENDIPIRLGPVGGRLVAEVFASLLRGDRTSYLYADPAFAPIAAFTRNGTFGLAELINVALGR
jgi:Animal haem peroxidase